MIRVPKCYIRKCRHYKGVKQVGNAEVPFCLAFPNGIPHDIAWGGNGHLRPVKGQTDKFTFSKGPFKFELPEGGMEIR